MGTVNGSEMRVVIVVVVVVVIIIIIITSLSPLFRVAILIFLRQTMSLGDTLLQLFSICCLWCLYVYYYYYYYYCVKFLRKIQTAAQHSLSVCPYGIL